MKDTNISKREIHWQSGHIFFVFLGASKYLALLQKIRVIFMVTIFVDQADSPRGY